MAAITVPLSDDALAKLTATAKRIGLSPEELARLGIEELLAGPADEFERASDYVLKKNAELYRRLG